MGISLWISWFKMGIYWGYIGGYNGIGIDYFRGEYTAIG
jgi:hypothetical protein